MRSIFIITMIFFLITACATQPAAPTATVTLPPTVTLTATPSFTAVPTLSPEQTQALADVNTALDQNLTANADGSVKNKNGEINKDFRYDLATGKLSLQVAGEWVMIDPADVSYDENGNVKSIAGYELQDGKWAAAEANYDFEISSDTGIIESNINGVAITSQIITAESLDGKGIGSILINEGNNNPKWSKENSETAINTFTLGLLHDVWSTRGGLNGTGPTDTNIDAAGYAALLASGDGEAAQIHLKNVYELGSDTPQNIVIAPFLHGPAPEGVRVINNVTYVFTNATRTEDMTIIDKDSGTAFKAIISDDTLMLYVGLGNYPNSNMSATATRMTKMMSSISSYLKGRTTFWQNLDLNAIIATEESASCYSSALQIFNGQNTMSKFEKQCNP